jgi:hypothetical protein
MKIVESILSSKFLILAVLAWGVCSHYSPAYAEVTKADRDFLQQQCQIFQNDADIIPNLAQNTQAALLTAIAARDCAKLTPFKNTRNYYHGLLELRAGERMYCCTPEGWDKACLTSDELKHYEEILVSHPPCQDDWPRPGSAGSGMSPAQRDFLLQQCRIPQADIDVIPQFIQKAQDNIARWIAENDARHLIPFKTTREYYRKLLENPGGKLPMPPATWDIDYLTREEFLNYINLLNHVPL